MMSPIIKKALYFSAEKHDGQYRKGGNVPYIVHPVQVAIEVGMYTNDPEVFAAALLHDVLEDCPGVSVELLEQEFGVRTAQMVSEVSFVGDTKYTTWKEKKEAYLSKIKEASKESLIIVAVDKMLNLESYFNALKKRGHQELEGFFGGTPDEYIWYYGAIEKILTSKIPTELVVKDYLNKLNSYTKQGL